MEEGEEVLSGCATESDEDARDVESNESYKTDNAEEDEVVHKGAGGSRDGEDWLDTASVQTTESDGTHEGSLSASGSSKTWATNNSFLPRACSAADRWSAEEEELTAEDLECPETNDPGFYSHDGDGVAKKQHDKEFQVVMKTLRIQRSMWRQ